MKLFAHLRSFGARVVHVVAHLMDDVDHERYTSLAPRRPDGSRPPIAPFNSSGGGR